MAEQAPPRPARQQRGCHHLQVLQVCQCETYVEVHVQVLQVLCRQG
jgi:hypothetical protein